MRRIDTGILTRAILVAIVAVFAVGSALHAGTGRARTERVPLLNALSDQDLAKFEAIDMADAVERVASASRTADSAK